MPASKDGRSRTVKGGGGTPAAKSKIEKETIETLKVATPAAAKLLVETMNNENLKIDVRLDAAKNIIDRVYGKSMQPIDGNMDATISIVMGGDVGELAK